MTKPDSSTRTRPSSRGHPFLKGLLTGLVTGVGLSAGIALYVSNMHSPFVAHNGGQSSTAPDRPAADMPDISKHGLMNPVPVGAGLPLPVPDSAATPPNPVATGSSPLPATPLPAAEPGPKPPEATTTVTNYFVQTGAFENEPEAENQRAHLALIGVEATILSPEAGDKILYRVRVGPIASVDEVRTLVATLKNNGFSTNIIKAPLVKPKDSPTR